jgi:hypothetical protein
MVSHITALGGIMSATATRDMARVDVPNRPRVWLVGRGGTGPEPVDLPAVRDTRMRTWVPGNDGVYHSADGWHHATWTELHARYDLVEVA